MAHVPVKTLAQKLRITPGAALFVMPVEHQHLVGDLPEEVRTAASLEEASIAVVFVRDAASTRQVLEAQHAALHDVEVLWLAYPKGNTTDINRDSLWKLLAPYGLRPVSQVAIDDTWSALRFRPLKPGEEPFTGGKGPANG
jgi:hypothetical protein